MQARVRALVETAPAAVSTCHICGSRRIAPFITASDNGHLRSDAIKLPVHHCRDCDVFFLNPPPPAEIGREYFAEMYAGAGTAKTNVYYDDAFKERVSRQRLDLLGRYAVEGRLLLDVGCGKGQFVHMAATKGWDAWGAELDAGACDYARSRFGMTTVRNGGLDNPELPAQFDVITLWDVIEHVPDPVRIFEQVVERLRPGGIVAVRTANIRSWAFDRHRAGWWAFGSDHRFYFSPRSLEASMMRAGLAVADVLNCETTERPDRQRSRDISDTTVGEGLRRIASAPAKLGKVGHYGRSVLRRAAGEWKYGVHYHTPIMTLIGRKPAHK